MSTKLFVDYYEMLRIYFPVLDGKSAHSRHPFDVALLR